MIGRDNERALIGRLFEEARSGRSGCLILWGEPGVGKSILLAHAMEQAAEMRVLQATGVETEVDLAFAGLHQLVRPVLPLCDRLPDRQADAIRGALGLVEHVSPDRFLVAAATLSLLSEAAEDVPVLVVVEDAHLLDQASSDAIAFAARRLEAEGIVLLAATRDRPWPGLPGAQIGGLERDGASELLRGLSGDVDALVRNRLIDETAGNPLALVELARTLSPEQMAGAEPLPRELPLTDRVQEAFLSRARLLPEPTQTLLVVASADDTADPAVIFRAAAQLGVDADALEAAERAGLIEVGSRGVEFGHPLVRAAVYQGASYASRVAAHRALAAALEGEDHAGRRAWHLAATTKGPDEDIAVLLERSAETARRRGGYAAAARGFERAAELSTTNDARGRRLAAAAQAAFQAGQADRAGELADSADQVAAGWSTAGERALLRGRIEFARGSAVKAHALLLAAARDMAQHDSRGAAAVLVEAARAAWNAYDPHRYAEVTALFQTLTLPDRDPLGPLVATAIAIGDFVTGPPAKPVERMRRAIDEWLPFVKADQAGGHDQAFVEASLALTGFTRVTADDAAGLAFGSSAVSECRARGLVGWMPWALANLSMTEAISGRHSAAGVSATEGLRLAQDLGQPTAICSCESILAWLAAVRGDEDRCRQLASDSVQVAQTHQLPAIAVTATWALGLLELSLGRPEQACDRLLDPVHGPMAVPSVRCLITPDLVEAAMRCGRTDEIAEAVDWYEEWASGAGQSWANAAVHRCRAMLEDGGAERHFSEALALYEEAGADQRIFDRARTQLLYGQWLRRSRRRGDARVQLARAHDTFERLDAVPWAERAGTELRATGQKVRRRGPAPVRLTPQEMQVVRLVAEGGSNREVAAQLFLSPRTVKYHLYKAFPKLGVTSRAELARLDLEEPRSDGAY